MTQLAAHAREPIAGIGACLTELTGNRPAASLHAEILDRLGEPDSDARLAGVTTDRQRFERIWDGLVEGADAPVDAWATVVLPAVVAGSTAQALKSNLERVTSLWLDARALLDSRDGAVPQAGPMSRREPERAVSAGPGGAVAESSPPDAPHTPAPARRRRPLMVTAVTVLAMLVTAALLWWQRDDQATAEQPLGGPIASSGARPSAQPTPGDTAANPSAAAVTQPLPALSTTQPAPAPTWSGPGPAVAPTAPRSLSIVDTGPHTAALSWQQPLDAGHSATLRTEPGSPVPLGQSFTVTGAGWPCSGTAVQVRLSGRLIAIAIGTVGGDGTFSVPVTVEPIDSGTARIDAVDSEQDLMLTAGQWRLQVRGAAQPACTTQASAQLPVVFG